MNLKPNVGCTAFQKPYKYLSCTGAQSSESFFEPTPSHGKPTKIPNTTIGAGSYRRGSQFDLSYIEIYELAKNDYGGTGRDTPR